MDELKEVKNMRKYLKPVAIIAIVWSLFQLYQAGIEPLTAQVQRAIHVAFALGLTFALVRVGKDSKNIIIRNLDYLFVILSLGSGLYIYLEMERLVSRIQFVSELTTMDYIVCIVVVLLVIEASRRTLGYTLTIMSFIFVAYAFLGPYLPGLIGHDGLSLKRMVEVMYFSLDGILGVPIGVSTDYVFYFVLFAAFLELSGGGQLFIDLAIRATKRSKGGPAKAAILASGGMGTISGSAVANVASTGIFTIPLMKRIGFPARYAASIEALASTGGQILPPIMGAAAFLMADTLGIPYAEIALAALIPALIYFAMLYVSVHLNAGKLGMKKGATGLEEVEKKKEKILDKIHLLLPLVILIYLIFAGKTLSLAAFYSILSVVIISYFRKSTRMGITQVLDALASGAKQAIQVAIPCAVAGIIVGVIIHSGLSVKFSSLIIEMSLGITFLSVILVAVGCILLGMGMPTTSAYIMAAVLLAPSLQQLGFEPLVSHMYIFYFACFSMITPPVALASYSAASIAKSDANQTGFSAFYMALPMFVVALSFVYNPALFLIGSPMEIIIASSSTMIGAIILSSALIGYLLTNLTILMRVFLALLSISLMVPSNLINVIGTIIFLAIFIFSFINRQKNNGDLEQEAINI